MRGLLRHIPYLWYGMVWYALMMRQSCIAFIASPLTMALSSVRQVPTDYPISLTWHGLTRRTHNLAIAAPELK